MPESTPPAPPSSQAGPYIAAIAVLVILIIGLVWFRLGKKEPPAAPPPIVTKTVSAVATPPPPMLDIPAPPELDAGDEDASDAGKTKPSRKVGRSLCSGTCNGKITPALRSALRGAAGAARGCYERALRTNEMLQGRIVVGLRVASNGRVCSASIVSDSVGSSQVSSCVIGMFQRRKFPAATGGCVDVNVPMNFVPKGKK